MDYYKLLNDYLNSTTCFTDCDVLNFENKGTFIEVYYKYADNEYRDKNIDLFDLITFSYAKNPQKKTDENIHPTANKHNKSINK